MKHWRALITKRRLATLVGSVVIVLATGYGLAISTRSIRSDRANAYLSKAFSDKSSNPRAAEADIQLALAITPHNPAVIAWAAEAYLQIGKSDEAVNQLKRLPLADGGGRLASVYLEERRFPEALAVLAKLLELRRDSVWVTQQAIALMEQGRGENALESLKTAYTGTPTPNIALYYALVSLATNHPDIAAQITTPDVLIQQQIIASRNNPIALGRILYEHGMPTSAKTVLISTDAASTAKFLLLARIELGRGSASAANIDEAISYLRSGILIDPSDLNLHQALRDTYRLKHDDNAAQTEQGKINQLVAGTP